MFEIKGIKKSNAEGFEKPMKEKDSNLIDFSRDQRIFMPHKNFMNLQGAHHAWSPIPDFCFTNTARGSQSQNEDAHSDDSSLPIGQEKSLSVQPQLDDQQ